MRLVFLGTPAFAVPTLERIAAAGHEVLLVVSQPDRPKGRGRKSAASPVKEAALRLGLPVFQPERIRLPETRERLAALAPEAMVVVGYGQIIPQSVIDLAPRGILNVHASLLPKYRGAAPVQWAIVNGETRTGVTVMQIDAGLDTGAILLAAETAIGPDETAPELALRLAGMGADLLVDTLARMAQGGLQPCPQGSAQASYAPILKKEDGRIDWNQPAHAIHNRVRGLLPWPGAYTSFRGHGLQIWKSRVAASQATLAPGQLRHAGGLFAGCGGDTAMELVEVQLEGRKKISAEDFANGQRLSENDRLGENR
jgi:methionyl-tRNA formyltransferase